MTTDIHHVAQRDVRIGMLICLAMMPTSLWLPSLLGALHDGYGTGPVALSRLAFSGVFGFQFACLFTSTKSIAQLRRWVLIACALLVAVHCSLMLWAPAVPFIVLQPLAGLGAGAGFGYVLKLCGASAHPTRNFGILTASTSVMMMIGFQAVGLLIGAYGIRDGVLDPGAMRQVVKMIFGIYASFALAGMLLLLSSRRPEPRQAPAAAAAAQGGMGPMVRLGLAAIVLTFMGHGSIWAFLQILGSSHGFGVAAVANAMSAFAIAGVVGSLTAAALPQQVTRSAVMGAAAVVLSGGLYALFAPASLDWYIAGCAIAGFYWNFVFPLLLGILARIDSTGRGPVLGGTMASLGSAFGPLLAGLVIHDNHFERVGWLVGGLCAAGLAGVIRVERCSTGAAPVALRSKAAG